MHQENVIKDIIIWIEQNLESPLTLDIIAKKSGYTKWHFQRLFKDYTGISLAKYIRARRLSCGAYALRVTNSSLLDISLKYHFDSQQTFCRAFKQYFKTTPSEYRKKVGWNINELCFPIRENTHLDAEINVVSLPVMNLMGIEHHYNKDISHWDLDNQKMRQRFWQKFFKETQCVPPQMYAVHSASVRTLDATVYNYTTAIENNLLSKVPNKNTLSSIDFLGGDYLELIFTSDNIFKTIKSFNDIIYTAYTHVLPSMNLLRRKGADLEFYKFHPTINYSHIENEEHKHLQEIRYYIPIIKS